MLTSKRMRHAHIYVSLWGEQEAAAPKPRPPKRFSARTNQSSAKEDALTHLDLGLKKEGEYTRLLLLTKCLEGLPLCSMSMSNTVLLRRFSNCLNVVCSDWSEAIVCRHGGHKGYSSISSHTIRDASVPPTVTSCRSPTMNRAQANGPEYTFASTNSALGVMHGYLESKRRR